MERAITGLTAKLTTRKSTKDLGQLGFTGKDLPTDASQYEILDDCGRGVSATVHRARCLTTGDIVAVKLMNLESVNCDLDEIIHEAQTMRRYNHPNILPLYCSFVHNQDLWMVMPFVSGGSVLHIMKYAYPEGLDEVEIATIGREVLKGLDYVHKNGSIHRDVKAGNILVDADGVVKLGDFGVAASLERGGSWGHDKQARMTFVGTPCWMAPEVMEQTTGYDFSADIWSFGITILEMCHGHAPFAKFPPMKVLLMTLQNPAPTLEDKGKRHFSKAVKDLVARCLHKEKDKRPTAAQLLEHKFFKLAKDSEYLRKNLLNNLPSLAERVQQIRTGKAATYVLDNDRNLEKSQEEYRKGVSSWNFDLAALKAQAALEPDDDVSGHGASTLPTISEMDERDGDTLTGASAAAAAMFVAAQGPEASASRQDASAAEVPSSRPYTSAFATASGQESVAKTNAILPPTALNLSSPPSMDVGGSLRSTSGDQSGLQVEKPSSAGSEAPPQSPSGGGNGGVSPVAGLSREGSVAANIGVMATTPTAVTKQKKGRFEVSEHPVPSSVAPAPSLSAGFPPAPVQPGTAPVSSVPAQTFVSYASMLSSTSASSLHSVPTGSGPSISGGTVPDLSFLRPASTSALSEAGAAAGAEEATVSGKPDREVEESVTSVEPKQRGRFKIVAEQGTSDSRPLSKASSLANLSDAKDIKNRSDGGVGGLMGKPPTAPTSLMTPVAVVLPKLQELLEHATAHQAALQKLMGAVQECEKGRVPLLLSRAQSTKSLFDNHLESADDLKLQLTELKSRMSSLEEENARLRDRNKVLETLHCVSEGASTAAAAPASSVRFDIPESNAAALASPTLMASPKNHVDSLGSQTGA